MTLDDALKECPIVAIVRGVKPDEVLAHADALYTAGIRGVEVPLNSPQPLQSIRLLADAWRGRMVVGAGTVLEASQVDAVAQAGGTLIVAPNTNAAVIRRAVELKLDPAPGFATASEAFAALAAGARHLKLFPAVTYGPGHLKQLKAVLPASAVVWAVGGAGPANMGDWWTAGARAFGLGGEIYKAGQSVADTATKAARAVSVARTLTGNPAI
jgi:2-dehydro-3-deoxyphosphogalactonate aldolase